MAKDESIGGLLGSPPLPPDRQTERASERGEGEHLRRPFLLPAAFTLSWPGGQRAPGEGAAARQLAKQWRPRFAGTLLLDIRWGMGGLGDSGVQVSPVTGGSPHLALPRGGVRVGGSDRLLPQASCQRPPRRPALPTCHASCFANEEGS